MSIINIVLFWIFFGFLTSYFAVKKGRNQKTWFIMGLALGIFGVLLILLMPSAEKRVIRVPVKVVVDPIITPKNPNLDKVWFFLDKDHKQQGPIYFGDFLKFWKKGEIKADSFVWSEGMNEWKRILDLPELHQEFSN